MERILHGGDSRVTCASVHGSDCSVIHAHDLQLQRFLPGIAEVVAAAEAAEKLPAQPERILLTGANGFLGRFLLLDLLQRVADRHVHTYSYSAQERPGT